MEGFERKEKEKERRKKTNPQMGCQVYVLLDWVNL
jgi:hypothetical protein